MASVGKYVYYLGLWLLLHNNFFRWIYVYYFVLFPCEPTVIFWSLTKIEYTYLYIVWIELELVNFLALVFSLVAQLQPLLSLSTLWAASHPFVSLFLYLPLPLRIFILCPVVPSQSLLDHLSRYFNITHSSIWESECISNVSSLLCLLLNSDLVRTHLVLLNLVAGSGLLQIKIHFCNLLCKNVSVDVLECNIMWDCIISPCTTLKLFLGWFNSNFHTAGHQSVHPRFSWALPFSHSAHWCCPMIRKNCSVLQGATQHQTKSKYP